MFVRDTFAYKAVFPLRIQICEWMQGHGIEGIIHRFTKSHRSQVCLAVGQETFPESCPRSREKSLTNSHAEFKCTYPMLHRHVSFQWSGHTVRFRQLKKHSRSLILIKMHALCSIRNLVNYIRIMCNIQHGHKTLQCHSKLKIIAAHNKQLKYLSIQIFIMN